MDFTPEDMRIAHEQGDAVNLVRLVAGFPTRRKKNPAEERSCPRCKASVGQKCTTPKGRRLPVEIHEERVIEHGGNKTLRSPGEWPRVGGRIDDPRGDRRM